MYKGKDGEIHYHHEYEKFPHISFCIEAFKKYLTYGDYFIDVRPDMEGSCALHSDSSGQYGHNPHTAVRHIFSKDDSCPDQSITTDDLVVWVREHMKKYGHRNFAFFGMNIWWDRKFKMEFRYASW